MLALLLAPALAAGPCGQGVPCVEDLQAVTRTAPARTRPSPAQDRARLEQAFEAILQEMDDRGFRYPRDAFLGRTGFAATINNFLSDSTGWGFKEDYKVCYEQVEYMNQRLRELLPDLAERYDFTMMDNQSAREGHGWIPGHYWGSAVPKAGGPGVSYDPRAGHFGGDNVQYADVLPWLNFSN